MAFAMPDDITFDQAKVHVIGVIQHAFVQLMQMNNPESRMVLGLLEQKLDCAKWHRYGIYPQDINAWAKDIIKKGQYERVLKMSVDTGTSRGSFAVMAYVDMYLELLEALRKGSR